MNRLTTLLVVCAATACASAGAAVSSNPSVPAPATVPKSEPCREYTGVVRGTVGAALTELSGWALSRRDANVLWAHNDRDDGELLIAVSATDGSVLGTVAVAGAPAGDWEDIATYQDPEGHAWIVVADTGDNSERRAEVRLVLIAEPEPAATSVTAAGVVTVRWANGAHDVEAMIVDPVSGEATFVGKRSGDADGAVGAAGVSVDVVPAEALVPGASVIAHHAGTFPVPAGQLFGPTAGSIDAAGDTVGLLFYGDLTMTWARQPGRSVAETIAGPAPCRVPTGLGQFEALAIAADGSLLVATEGRGVPLSAFSPVGS